MLNNLVTLTTVVYYNYCVVLQHQNNFKAMEISFFITSFVSLFALINPLSALPVFISLTEHQEPKWRNEQIRKTCMYIIIICLCSYLIGSHILAFFGISISALKIAGGIMISRSGFLLLNAKHKRDVKGDLMKESMEKEDISFSPLAMPLLAGPGSISLLINMSIESPLAQKGLVIVLAILSVTLCIYAIFTVAPRILSYTGQAGLKSMSKIMGFLVLSIGIEMISSSVLNMIKGLHL
jgi:multiple antibiotic resistance protein